MAASVGIPPEQTQNRQGEASRTITVTIRALDRARGWTARGWISGPDCARVVADDVGAPGFHPTRDGRSTAEPPRERDWRARVRWHNRRTLRPGSMARATRARRRRPAQPILRPAATLPV